MSVITLHTFDGTQDWFCDGMPCFEVLIRRKHGGNEISYWCNGMHTYMQGDMHPSVISASTCPLCAQHGVDDRGGGFIESIMEGLL